MRKAIKIIARVIKASWYALIVATPLLGVWLASSLAAYLNGPLWAACLAGVLAFPGLPLTWELVGRVRYRQKVERLRAAGEQARGRWLTAGDRFILRTLAINLVFLGVLGGLFPQDSFTALSTRGDWMLTGHDEPWAAHTRTVLFGAAGGLEWLYNATRDNPYEKWADTDHHKPVPRPVPGRVEQKDTSVAKDDHAAKTMPVADKPGADKSVAHDTASTRTRRPGEPPSWPMPDHLHPLVAHMPASAETSPEAVAQYIAQREHDPYLRVKALYDYVADRVRYDVAALQAGDYPPQDPQTVFRTHKAVCAGYSKLLQKMAKSIGIDMVYVVGVSRDQTGSVAGGGHAWNAVEIEGKWYLIDATWGAGTVDGGAFHKRYTTDYLFTPPKVFGVDHFPDDARWQLRGQPLTRGAFVRQPMLRAGFFERGYELISPKRSQVSVDDVARIDVRRPAGQDLIASLFPADGGKPTRCRVTGRDPASIRCKIAHPGSFEVRMFSSTHRVGIHPFIGKIAVNSRF